MGDRVPSLQYLKQGLGRAACSVKIVINEDQAGRAEVQALDVLHHLSQHCQLQSLQLSSDCSSGIGFLDALSALTSLTRLALQDVKVTSGEVEVHYLLQSSL